MLTAKILGLVASLTLLTAPLTVLSSELKAEADCSKSTETTTVTESVDLGSFILTGSAAASERAGCKTTSAPPWPPSMTKEEAYAAGICPVVCRPTIVATVIRAADFASFRPRQPLARSEPTSWAPVGLPANFYAEIEPHTIEGTLLGKPAVARFTPASYRWDFGDGSTRTVRGKGAPWKAQSLNEFSDTATSHTFDRSGDYYVTLTVNYSIEYYYEEDADDGWEEFIGYLPIASAPIAMHVAAVKTVLVSKTCLENPNGPGC